MGERGKVEVGKSWSLVSLEMKAREGRQGKVGEARDFVVLEV